MTPFIILALPRSRTKWLSSFLSYGPWHCGHDQLQYAREMADVDLWLDHPFTGTCETAAAPFWRLLAARKNPPKIITVRRSITDVLASVRRQLPGYDAEAAAAMLLRADRKLDQIEARVPGVLSVKFDDLNTEAGCETVFEHCLEMKHDWLHWEKLAPQVISGDVAAQVRYCQIYLPQMQKLTRAAKHQSLAMMARPVAAADGFSFQEESFDDWYRDAQPLFRDHMLATGQDVEDYSHKNLPLLRMMDAAGSMQIMTARSNGRIFGYLLALISPTLDDAGAMMAQFLPIFASKDCPGLGMKLMRASIEALRGKGITEIVGRSGVRGSGPKLGAAYRRLGFENAGQLFRLDVQGQSAWA